MERSGTDGIIFYHQDGLGSTSVVSSVYGEVLLEYDYDAFGNLWDTSGSSYNPMQFTGEYFDETGGLLYLRARYYDPNIGRFISPDSYTGELTDPLSQNLYVYCGNNPVAYTDPSGHIKICPIREAVRVMLGSSATVTWDSEYYGVFVSYNGNTEFFAANSNNIINGHLYIDPMEIDQYFGGTIYDPIPVDTMAGGLGGLVKGVIIKRSASAIAGSTLASELRFDLQLFGQETVKDILKTKKGSIKNAALGKGAPGWDDIINMTMDEINKNAKAGKPGYKTIKKLLTDKRFDR